MEIGKKERTEFQKFNNEIKVLGTHRVGGSVYNDRNQQNSLFLVASQQFSLLTASATRQYNQICEDHFVIILGLVVVNEDRKSSR